MDQIAATEALTALGHPGRMAVFRLLARRAPQGVRPSEIAEALGLKPNTLSVYVTTLARAGLVASERDGRSVFYRVDLSHFGELTRYLVADCGRGRPEIAAPLVEPALGRRSEGPVNVLFLCTGNSARSIFAEALLARDGGERFRGWSAGTEPYGAVNPEALALLREIGHDTDGLRSKDLAEVTGPDAPRFDLVVTVCDRAANEECPTWPGHPVCAHWGVADPVQVNGSATARRRAFRAAYDAMARRVAALVALPVEELDRGSMQARLDGIGLMQPPAGIQENRATAARN
jgi:arsenate reductase